MPEDAPFQKDRPATGLPFQKDSLTLLASTLTGVPYDRVTPTQRAAAKLFTYVRGAHPHDDTLKSITNEVMAATLMRAHRR